MKSRFLFLSILLGAISVFWGCSKETSIESDLTVDSLAEIQFVDVDSTIYGYQSGTFVTGITDSTSYIAVPVTVTKAGTFSISAYVIYNSDTLHLSNSGSIDVLMDSIKLYGSNIASFAAGSYSSNDSTLNKLTLNDSTITYPFVANIVVSE